MKLQLLLILCIVGVGLAWNQPSTCYVRQSTCSSDSELRGIRDTLVSIQETLHTSLSSISASLQYLGPTTNPPTEVSTTATPPIIGSFDNPAISCSNITSNRPSGEYWIVTDRTSSPIQVYCDTNRKSCSCNTAGGWTRVASLNMTDPGQNCPDGFRLIDRADPPLRICGRPGPAGCVSTTYSSYGIEYSRVCGRVIGYQDSSLDGFEAYFHNRSLTIDGVYVDGVSLTHGQSPRQHIWTFVGTSEDLSNNNRCPCTAPEVLFTGVIPPFMGQDYFCESGADVYAGEIFYPDDPLWNGLGCDGSSNCCELNNSPWFCKQLPQSTRDDIELRLCGDGSTSDEDTPLEIVQIYVQ